jgi:hypothetical protein
MDRLWLSDNIALGVAMKHFIDSLDAEKLTEQDIVAMQMYVSEDDEPEEDLMSWPEEQILGYDELLQEIEWDI